MYIDNQAAIQIMSKSTRGRNRHMDIRLKFLKAGMTTEQFDFTYIPSTDNDADIGTKVLPLPTYRKLRARVAGDRPDAELTAMLAQIVHDTRSNTCALMPIERDRHGQKHVSRAGSPGARTRRAGGVSELPNSTSYRSPVSVATAIDDMAETIVVRATQRAKEAIAKAGHRAVRHHWHSK